MAGGAEAAAQRGQKGRISRFRLALNAVGCAAMIAFCLLVGLSLVDGLHLLTPPAEAVDGDRPMGMLLLGAGLCALVAALSLISLLRSVRAWRDMREPRET